MTAKTIMMPALRPQLATLEIREFAPLQKGDT